MSLMYHTLIIIALALLAIAAALFITSIVYLPLLLAALVFTKI